MVHACQKTGNCASPEIEKMADNMTKKAAKDFAKTKHKGLPNRAKNRKFSAWLKKRAKKI